MSSPIDVIDDAARRPRAHVNGTRQGTTSEPWAELLFESDDTWFSTPPLARTWLLRDARNGGAGVLPVGKVGMLFGEGGVSKSMSLVALAIAVATGTQWLGSFSVGTPGRVLAIFGEEELEEVRRRVYNVALATKPPAPTPGAIVVIALAGVPCAMVETDLRGHLDDGPFLLWLRREIDRRGPFSPIIVDPLSRFAGMEAEVDNAAATRFVQALESIATLNNATVLVAHHSTKASRGTFANVTGASARGSSAIYDGVRWAATLSPETVDMGDGDVFGDLTPLVRFSVVKSNYALKPESLLLRRDAANGGALIPLDRTEQEIVANARRSSTPVRKRERQAKARNAEVMATIREVLGTTPGLSGRALLQEVLKRRGSCSREVFNAALALLGEEVRKERGPDNSMRHFLVGQEGGG